MKMRYEIGVGQVTIQFDGKPAAVVRSALKANGFRWSPGTRCWWRRQVSGAADLIGAIKRMINPMRPDGVCWACGDASGFFRNQGAATPVLCDACSRAYEDEQRRIRGGGGEDYPCSDMGYEDSCREACGL